jgi:hypothetical protein
MNLQPVAVVLDLMHPHLASRRLLAEGRGRAG